MSLKQFGVNRAANPSKKRKSEKTFEGRRKGLAAGLNPKPNLANGPEFLLYRQCDDDACAVTGAGFDADLAVMRFNDAAVNGQAESGAFGFCRA